MFQIERYGNNRQNQFFRSVNARATQGTFCRIFPVSSPHADLKILEQTKIQGRR